MYKNFIKLFSILSIYILASCSNTIPPYGTTNYYNSTNSDDTYVNSIQRILKPGNYIKGTNQITGFSLLEPIEGATLSCTTDTSVPSCPPINGLDCSHLSLNTNQDYANVSAVVCMGDQIISDIFISTYRFVDFKKHWESLGTASFSAGSSWLNTITFDNNGIPYVAYVDSSVNNHLTVKKYDNILCIWETVGIEGFSDGRVAFGENSPLSLNFDSNNNPIVTFQDGAHNNVLVIMQYDTNSNTWLYLKNPEPSTPGSNYIETNKEQFKVLLNIDNNNFPVATYITSIEDEYKAKVQRYNGTNWEELNINSGNYAMPIASIIANDGEPIIAYQGEDNVPIVVKKYNGTDSWIQLGTNVSDGGSGGVSLALASDGNPVIAYSDNNSSGELIVKKYNGTDSWIQIGGQVSTGEAYDPIQIVIDNNGDYIVAYRDPSEGVGKIKKYDGFNWTELSGSLTDNTGLQDLELTLLNNTIPFFAYTNEIGQIHVSYHNNTEWVAIPDIVVNFDVYQISLAIATDDNPVIAYSDAYGEEQIIVIVKYNGIDSWEQIGTNVNVDECSTEKLSLAINNEGNPVILYNCNSNLSAKIYDGSTWNFIKNQTTTNIISGEVSDAFFHNGELHFMFADMYDNNKAKIMKFNTATSDFEEIEISAPTTNPISNPMLASDGTNLYALFREQSTDEYFFKKYETNSWSELGHINNKISNSDYISIVVDETGNPFISFADPNINSKASVLRFNGTEWRYLLGGGFLETNNEFVKIALDSNTIPHVISRYGAMFVKDSSSWLSIADFEDFVEADSQGAYLGYYFNVAIDTSNNIPYIVYRSNESPYKLNVRKLGEKSPEAPNIYPEYTDFINEQHISVSMNTDTVTGKIYYTIDGSTPDKTSNLYTSPFDITGTNETIIIKAITYSDLVDNPSFTTEHNFRFAP